MSAVPAPGQVSTSRRRLSKVLVHHHGTKAAKVETTWRILIVTISLVSNAALLICQQVAIRLLAPLIGSSIETWSAILGVFLLGIAIGNFIAGKLADRCSATKMIAVSLMLGAVSVLLMQLVVFGLTSATLFASLPLGAQTLVASIAVCLLPGITLSLVTPPSIRSLVLCAADAGAASGRIFAWGTLGSLLGNYLTGFVLIAMFGIGAIVHTTWISLLVLACMVLIIGKRVGVNRRPSQVPDQGTIVNPLQTAKDPVFEALLAKNANAWSVIDNFDSGRFLASAVRTTQSVFGNVNLMLPGKPAPDTRNVL